MSDSDAMNKIVLKIKDLYNTKLGQKKGVIMSYHESMEVGIKTYNYYVIGQNGLYFGYWTDSKPRLVDKTIVSRIVENEDCQEWDTLDNKLLEEIHSFLVQY